MTGVRARRAAETPAWTPRLVRKTHHEGMDSNPSGGCFAHRSLVGQHAAHQPGLCHRKLEKLIASKVRPLLALETTTFDQPMGGQKFSRHPHDLSM